MSSGTAWAYQRTEQSECLEGSLCKAAVLNCRRQETVLVLLLYARACCHHTQLDVMAIFNGVSLTVDDWPLNDKGVPEVDAELAAPRDIFQIIQQRTACRLVEMLRFLVQCK